MDVQCVNVMMQVGEPHHLLLIGYVQCTIMNIDGDRTAIGAIDPCRVNSTVFAEFGRCNPRCVSRRDDGCFMCDTTCNSKLSLSP